MIAKSGFLKNIKYLIICLGLFGHNLYAQVTWSTVNSTSKYNVTQNLEIRVTPQPCGTTVNISTNSNPSVATFTYLSTSYEGNIRSIFSVNKLTTGTTSVTANLVTSCGTPSTYTFTYTVTPGDLTITGVTANNKVYDKSTAAVINKGTAALAGVLAGDVSYVTLSTTSATGAFTSNTVGNGKSVTTSGFTISGTRASRYNLIQPSTTANITPKALTVTGFSATSKTYDRSVRIAVTGTPSLSGVISGDNVSLPTNGGYAAYTTTPDYGIGKSAKVVYESGGDYFDLDNLSGANAANYTLTQPSLTVSINKKSLSVSGVTVANKTYDAQRTATTSGTPTLAGKVTTACEGYDDQLPGFATYSCSADVVTASISNAEFSASDAGAAKPAIVWYSLSGTQALNYSLAASNLSATINSKSLTINNITVANKTYDGTTSATASGGTIAPDDVLTGPNCWDEVEYEWYNCVDNVSIGSYVAQFASAGAGSSKPVTISTSLTGARSSNYIATTTSANANITAKDLTISNLLVQNKEYDGTKTATLLTAPSLNGVVPGDTVSLNAPGTLEFATKTVGVQKTVLVSGLSLSGAQATNYNLQAPTAPTADIYAKNLNITGITANNRDYDGTVNATVSGTPVLIGAISGDNVQVAGTPVYFFGSSNAMAAKPVFANNFSLSGTDAANYTLAQPANLEASIFPKMLSIGGVIAEEKTYDGSNFANIVGTPVAYLTGVVGTDDVGLSGMPVGTFMDKNAAMNKPVMVNGYFLSGLAKDNYTLGATNLTATILKRPAQIIDVSAISKTYDGTAAATLSGTPNIQGLIAADFVTVNSTLALGQFDSPNVGSNKDVTLSGYSLNGVDALNYQVVQPTGLTANITTRTLSLTGLAIANKSYNGSTLATITGTPALGNVVGTDDVSLSGSPVANFTDPYVGNSKPVTISGYVLAGAQKDNYNLIQPLSVMGNILTKELLVSNVTAANKVYDGNNIATLSGTPALSGVVGADAVSLNATTMAAVFNNENAGNAKTVTVTGYVLQGGDAINYSLTQPTGLTANITKKSLSLSGVQINNKIYDGTNGAEILANGSLAGIIGTDDIGIDDSGASAQFANPQVGIAKPVTATGFALSGADQDNYLLSQPTSLVADITAKSLIVTGLSANSKIYNGNTLASLTGTAVLSGVVGADAVSLSGSPIANFTSAGVGNGIPVNVSGYGLSGAQSLNYTLSPIIGLNANITLKDVSISGLSVENKIYDGTDLATLSGVATLNGIVVPDVVTLSGVPDARFNDETSGSNKPVTVTGYTLTGGNAGNYNLLALTGLTGDIAGKAVTISGLSTVNRSYNGTSDVSIAGTPTLLGVQGGDDVSVSGSAVGTVGNANVGAAKPVTVSGLTLTGAQADQYIIIYPINLTVNINPKTISVTGVQADSKEYDGTDVATLSGTPVFVGVESGDEVLAGTNSAHFVDEIIGNGKSVVVDTYGISGADAANYSLTLPVGLTADITIRTLTLSGLSAEDKTYNKTTVATLIGTPVLDGIIGADVVNLSGTATGNFADDQVGNSKIVNVSGYNLTGTHAVNYQLASPVLNANIRPKHVQVSGLLANNRPYDGTTSATLSGTASLVGVESGDDVSLSGTATGEFPDKNTGNGLAVEISGYSLSGADVANYVLDNLSGITANITPVNLSITGLSGVDRVYNQSAAASINGVPTLIGILGSDEVFLTGTSAALFANATAGADKAITVSGYSLGGADALNYTLTQPTGLTATISPKTVQITGLTASNKTYDRGVNAVLGGAPALSGVLGGDEVFLDATGKVAVFNTNAVGLDKPITVSGYALTGTESANYSLVQPAGLTAAINPKALTLTGVTVSNKVYNGSVQATLSGTPNLVGIESGDVVTVGGTPGADFANKNVGTDRPVTVYGYALEGADRTNYTISQPTGLSASITSRPLTIIGQTVNTKAYDSNRDATLSGTATLTNIVGAEDVTLSGTSVAQFNTKEVGTAKPVSVTGYTLNGADVGNYTLQPYNNLSGTITRKSLTVNGITVANKVYDKTVNAVLAGTPALSGVVGGENVQLGTGTPLAVFADSLAANDKPILVSGFNLAGTDTANYTLNQPTGLTASIIPRILTLSGLSVETKTYDGQTQATLIGSETLVNVISGDDVALSGTLFANFSAAEPGANKVVTLSGLSLAGVDKNNYALASPLELTGDVNAATLTISGISGVSKVYDGTIDAELSGTAILDGVLGSEDVGLVGAGTAVFLTKTVGNTKTINVTGFSLQGSAASNYLLQQPLGLTANITRRALSIEGLSAQDKEYDGSTQATLSGTPSLSNRISGDIVTLGGVASAQFSSALVATHIPVSVSGYNLLGADTANYSLASLTGLQANITRKTLSVDSLEVVTKTYDGTLSATLEGGRLAGVVSGDNLTLAGTGSALFRTATAGVNKVVDVAGYYLIGSDTALYSLPTQFTINGEIAKKELFVDGVVIQDKTYNGNTTAEFSENGTLLGRVGTDVVIMNFGSASASFSNANVGTQKTVSIAGYTISGTNAANYQIVQPENVVGNILPLGLSVTGLSATSRVYNGSSNVSITGTPVLAGKIGSDEVTLSGTLTGLMESPAADLNKEVSVSGFVLQGAKKDNYTVNPPTGITVNISPKALTVVNVEAKDKEYDGTLDAELGAKTGVSLGVTGVVTGDQVSLGGATAYFSSKNVGTNKAVTVVNYTLAGSDAGNYYVDPAQTSLASLKADITPAELTITIADTTAGGEDPEPEYRVLYSGFVGSDDESVVRNLFISREAGTEPGEYEVIGSEATATNYTFRYDPGIFTLTSPIPVLYHFNMTSGLLLQWREGGFEIMGLRGMVQVLDLKGRERARVWVDHDGFYPLNLEPGRYLLKAEKNSIF
jgi:hypothetical protein